METDLRAALVAWLRADQALAGALNVIAEEAPLRANPPWLGLVASAGIDWSTKDRAGREVRIALELHLRGDDPAGPAPIVRAVEDRVASLPDAPGLAIVTCTFLRSRAEQRANNTRAILLEYRFRLLSTEN